jgi:hypothetical protein
MKKKTADMKSYHRQWARKNREKCRLKARLYKERNLDKVRERGRITAKKYRIKNAAKIREKDRKRNKIRKAKNRVHYLLYSQLNELVFKSEISDKRIKKRYKEFWEAKKILNQLTKELRNEKSTNK